MKNFIEVTTDDGCKETININSISRVLESSTISDYTFILLNNEQAVSVEETYEGVLTLIKKAQE